MKQMIEEIQILQVNIFEKLSFTVSHLTKDMECDEYFGYSFKLDHWNIKFRKAKITPKKIGQFVTLWKRNPETREIEPFNGIDPFDFYIIATEFNNQSGFFFFPKSVLIQNNILTDKTKIGKRGFRVYPTWDIPENKQALKTQKWQTEFFINISNKESDNLSLFSKMLSNNKLK